MKKSILSLIVFLSFYSNTKAQAPQFAVVKPDGTTYICPTFDSAYNKAINGDNIYLPGGNFSLSNPISKSVHIYGAGYNQDSSTATNITTLTSLTILQGADNGSIEGVLINSGNPQTIPCLTFGDNQNQTPFANYTIKYCFTTSWILFNMPSSNITISNCYFGFNGSYGGTAIAGNISNSLISNNIILGNSLASSAQNPYLQVNNNIFFWYYTQGATFFYFATQSTYQNNIFQVGGGVVYWSSSNSNFYNNSNGYPYGGPGNIYSGYINETLDLTFINPGSSSGTPFFIYTYDVHNDYHIKPTSLCKNSGTDGTDRGIYGGAFPWKDGSIPSNPHIYFKQVAPTTNSNGQLQIQFKVRTEN